MFEYFYSWKLRFVLFVPIQTFCWFVNCTVLVCKFWLLFQTILDLWPVLTLEVYSSEILRRVSFNSSLLFQLLFFWSVNWFLVFRFLVFSVYKNPKFNHHLPFLAIFPDLEMLQFWSVNYICQVYNLYFYFGHVQNFGKYLYFSVFSKQ